MLNAALVEQIQQINSQRLSGALSIWFSGRELRFFFQEGELQLLDYCQDMEVQLASQYKAYHKVGPEIEAVVVQMYQTQGIKVADYLRQQQLVTDGEVEQITRTLVEDALCDVFGSASEEMHFDPASGPDSFQVGVSAVKLRIQVDLLLQMVQARVAERDAVRAQIPDYGVSFSLEEGAPPADSLNDMERNVLHVVDGRKSVEELASLIRDSSLNTACYLVSLSNQGFVRQSRGTTKVAVVTSAPEPAVAEPVAPVAPDRPTVPADVGVAVPEAAPVEEEWRPVYRIQEPPRSKAPLYVLGTILIVMLALGYLVVSSKGQRRELDQLRDQFDQAIAVQAWEDGEDMLGQLYDKAAIDKRQVAALDALVASVNAKFIEQLDDATELVDGYAFAEARSILESVPPANANFIRLVSGETRTRSSELVAKLERLETEVDRDARVLAGAVEKALQRIAGLLADPKMTLGSADQVSRIERMLADVTKRLVDKPDPVTESARGALGAWRAKHIDEAGHPSMAIVKRQGLINLLKQADPTDSDLARIERLQLDVEQAGARLAADIKNLQVEFNNGGYADVAPRIAALLSLSTGGPQAETLALLKTEITSIQERIGRILEQTNGALRHARTAKELNDAVAMIDKELTTWGARTFSDKEELQGVKEALQFVTSCLGQATNVDEIAALRDADAIAKVPARYRKAIEGRVQALLAEEQRLDRGLASLIEARGQKGLEESLPLLREFAVRDDVKRSQALAKAKQALAGWESEMKERDSKRQDLHKAMLAEQPDEVDRLGKVLRLPRLPLAIFTSPAGARVSIDGKVIGQTPVVVDDIAPKRVQNIYRISLKGYESTELKAVDAMGGWKLFAELERAPVAKVQVEGPLTSQPAFVDGKVWIAGSSSVVSVDLDGKAKEMRFDAAGIGKVLQEPVYAPAVAAGGQVFFATRDQVVLRVADGKLQRQPMSGRTNFQLLRYVNVNVLDREMVVVVGLDGRLQASDPAQSGVIWKSGPGAAFAGPPILIGDNVHVVRIDGTMEIYQVDDGIQVSSFNSLKEKVLSVWPVDGGIAGLTTKSSFIWVGERFTKKALPAEVIKATRGAILTADYRLHLEQEDGSWQPVSKVNRDEDRVHHLIRWNDHIVVIKGQELRVHGERTFVLTTKKDFLAPLVADDRLVVATTDGVIQQILP